MESSSPPLSPKEWTHTMKHDQLPVLTMSLTRPCFPSEGKTARIERYFDWLAQHWIDRWKNTLFANACRSLDAASGAGSMCQLWNASLQFTVTYWNDPIISIRLDATESTDTPRPTLFCMGETWDCSTGYPRTLRSFFPPKFYRWKQELMRIIKTQAEEQLNSGESLLDPNCTTIMERAFDSSQFYLTEQGLNIFYPLYTLGPYAEGIPVFIVPFDTFSRVDKN